MERFNKFPTFEAFIKHHQTMKKHFLTLFALLLGLNYLNANPVDQEKAKTVGQRFACAKFNNNLLETNDLQLVYTGT